MLQYWRTVDSKAWLLIVTTVAVLNEDRLDHHLDPFFTATEVTSQKRFNSVHDVYSFLVFLIGICCFIELLNLIEYLLDTFVHCPHSLNCRKNEARVTTIIQFHFDLLLRWTGGEGGRTFTFCSFASTCSYPGLNNSYKSPHSINPPRL